MFQRPDERFLVVIFFLPESTRHLFTCLSCELPGQIASAYGYAQKQARRVLVRDKEVMEGRKNF